MTVPTKCSSHFSPKVINLRLYIVKNCYPILCSGECSLNLSVGMVNNANLSFVGKRLGGSSPLLDKFFMDNKSKSRELPLKCLPGDIV